MIRAPERRISCLSRSFSSLRRVRVLMLFKATLRAWGGKELAKEMVWMTAGRTRRGQPFGSGTLAIATLGRFATSPRAFVYWLVLE